MKKYAIKDIDGNVLTEGLAKTRKDFIREKFDQGLSFERADLRGWDLSFLDLSNIVLKDAWLSPITSEKGEHPACLRGTKLQGADMRGVDATGVMADGCDLTGTKAQGMICSGGSFRGALAPFANFRGAAMNMRNGKPTDFSDLRAGSSVFSHVIAEKAIFKGAVMNNVDFGNSTLVGCDWRGMTVEQSQTLAPEHLPNRTRNAIIVGGKYDDETSFPKSNMKAFARDRFRMKALGGATFIGTGVTALWLSTLVPDEFLANLIPGESLGSHLVLVVGAGMLLKDIVVNRITDALGSTLAKVAVKSTVADMTLSNKMQNLGRMVFAFGSQKNLSPIHAALKSTKGAAKKKGVFAKVRSLFNEDMGSFIYCDRKHLAMAMSALSANRNRGHELDREIVLVRKMDEFDDESVPSCIRFHKSGETTAVWNRDDKPAFSATYDAAGNPTAAADLRVGRSIADLSIMPHSSNMNTATNAFERKIVDQNGLSDLVRYCPKDHYLHQGKDHSILIYKKGTRRLDNKRGPAVILPDDTALYYKNGKTVKPFDASHPAKPKRKRHNKQAVEADACGCAEENFSLTAAPH